MLKTMQRARGARDWRGWRWLAPLLVAALSTAVCWMRMSAAARGVLWAEDGAIFLARAADPQRLTAWIFTPYDGYTHALSQLIALTLWNTVPVAYMAVAFTFASCAVAGAVAGVIFALTGRWRLNLPGRLLLAGTTVLVPGLTFEVIGNLANIHWFLLWLMPFLLLTRPRSWYGAAALGLLAFLIATSEVQSFLFAPLLLWHLRDRRRWPLVAGVVAGGVIQSVAILGGSRDRGTLASALSTIDGYVLQVPLAGVLGTSQAASSTIAHSTWLAAYAAMIPFLLCAVWFGWHSRRRLLVAVLFVAASGALWVAGFVVNYQDSFDYASMDNDQLIAGIAPLRYAVVPTMFLFGVVALAIGGDRGGRHGRLSGAGVAALILVIAILAIGVRVDNGAVRAASGPNWRSGVATAQEQCATTEATTATIQIAPQGWAVDLECSSLLR